MRSLLLGLLLLLAPCARAAHYALMVGIDHYDPAYGVGDLPSCINDANGMHSGLLSDPNRWSNSRITTLIDGAATESAIRSALGQLATTAVAGDVVVYFHSSHGGTHGGTDTYLCSYNASYEDYEIAADLAAFADGVTVIVVVDACFSAGLFKVLGGETARSWNLAASVMGKIDVLKAGVGRGVDFGWLTACNYDQLSWASQTYSLFAGYVIEAFAEGDADQDGDVSFLELFNYAAPLATALNPSQTAQKLNDSVLSGTVAVGAAPLSASAISFSINLPGHWVVVQAWDQTATQWVFSERSYDAYKVEVPGILPNRWYWLGIWDETDRKYVHSGWTGRLD